MYGFVYNTVVVCHMMSDMANGMCAKRCKIIIMCSGSVFFLSIHFSLAISPKHHMQFRYTRKCIGYYNQILVRLVNIYIKQISAQFILDFVYAVRLLYKYQAKQPITIKRSLDGDVYSALTGYYVSPT